MDFFRLLGINLLVTFRNLIEYSKVVRRYYSNADFRRVDMALLKEYVFESPFRISKHFLREQGAVDIYAYGETPLTAMDHIAKECGISAEDCVFELGCGRGRTCFWLNVFKGCRVVGVDFVPQFIEKANSVKLAEGVEGVEFRLEDMLNSDLAAATVVYLYGTCYDDDFVRVLIEKFKKLPKGTSIITVSYSLEEFGTEEFVLKRCFPVQFTWGIGDVYLQVRK